MKQLIILLFLSLPHVFLFAQENFTLSLKLVKSSGDDMYFEARLQNNNDSLKFLINGEGNGYYWGNQKHSFLRVIYEEVNGKERTSERQMFFYFDGIKKYILIQPGASWLEKIPPFLPGGEMGEGGYGIFPRDVNTIRKCRKIRIKLEKFTFVTLHSSRSNSLFPIKTIDLYSNWVDIPQRELIELLENCH